MPQGTLPFHYAEEKSSTGMTGLSGLAMYLDMAQVAGMSQSVSRHVRVRESGQGWTDSQMIISLVMLNLAGGESVDDPRSGRGQVLRILEADEGLSRLLRMSETHRMRRSERRAQSKRWRRERRRSVPSPSAVFRYLRGFHNTSEEDIEYTGQQYAEVCFVPNWVGHSLNSPEYRYLTIREPLRKAAGEGDSDLLGRWRRVDAVKAKLGHERIHKVGMSRVLSTDCVHFRLRPVGSGVTAQQRR